MTNCIQQGCTTCPSTRRAPLAPGHARQPVCAPHATPVRASPARVATVINKERAHSHRLRTCSRPRSPVHAGPARAQISRRVSKSRQARMESRSSPTRYFRKDAHPPPATVHRAPSTIRRTAPRTGFCRSRSGLVLHSSSTGATCKASHGRGQSSPAFLLSGKGLLSMFSPRELRNRGDRGTSAGDVETLSGAASTVADRNSDDEPTKSMPMLSGLTVASGGGSTDMRFSAALIGLRSCGCTRVLPLASWRDAKRHYGQLGVRQYGACA